MIKTVSMDTASTLSLMVTYIKVSSRRDSNMAEEFILMWAHAPTKANGLTVGRKAKASCKLMETIMKVSGILLKLVLESTLGKTVIRLKALS